MPENSGLSLLFSAPMPIRSTYLVRNAGYCRAQSRLEAACATFRSEIGSASSLQTLLSRVLVDRNPNPRNPRNPRNPQDPRTPATSPPTNQPDLTTFSVTYEW